MHHWDISGLLSLIIVSPSHGIVTAVFDAGIQCFQLLMRALMKGMHNGVFADETLINTCKEVWFQVWT